MSIVFADGEAGRAATVGWIILAAAVAVGVLVAVVALVNADEKLMDRLAARAPTYSPAWFTMVVAGLGLIAVAYIVSSFGIGLLGAITLIIVWRISARE